MKSKTARRIIFALAIAGTVGAILAGPMLALRWVEGSIPLSPWNTDEPAAGTGATRTIDLPRETYAFTWPARSSPRPAPTLRMSVAPTDWHDWWSASAGAGKLALHGDTPLRLSLDVTVPDGEAITPESIGKLCEARPGTPGACRLGHAKVEVLHEDEDTARYDIVSGAQAPATDTRRSSEGRTMATRYAFWTRIDTASGERRFLGWACDGGIASLPLPAPAAASPDVLYRCHAPNRWRDTALPALGGLERAHLYYACDAADRCELLFPFQGRLVVMSFDETPAPREIETTRLRLFLAAWAMLNRLHEDALYPRGAMAELPEGYAQLAACRAISAALNAFGAASGTASAENSRDRDARLAIPCRRAADIASRLARSAPAEAEGILASALPVMARLVEPDSNEAAYYEAWITAVRTSASGATSRMAEALTGLLARTPGVARDQPGFEAREAQILAARTFVTGAGDALPDETRDRLVAALVRQYRGTARENDAVTILEEHVEALSRARGHASPVLGSPLVRLGETQRDRDNFIGLRKTSEHLLAVWQNPASAAAWNPTQEGQIGFAVVLFLRTMALHDNNTASATAVIGAVVDRLVKRLGPTDPYVRAAQFHQREVLAGHAVAGAPAGGGFLPGR